MYAAWSLVYMPDLTSSTGAQAHEMSTNIALHLIVTVHIDSRQSLEGLRMKPAVAQACSGLQTSASLPSGLPGNDPSSEATVCNPKV